MDSHWIDPTHEIPPDGNPVLVWQRNILIRGLGRHAISRCRRTRHGAEWDCEQGRFNMYQVTHWMPLPERPPGKPAGPPLQSLEKTTKPFS
jgi:hypothetical protein